MPEAFNLDLKNRIIYLKRKIKPLSLYSRLQDHFDQIHMMDDPIPMEAIDRWTFQLLNGWTIAIGTLHFLEMAAQHCESCDQLSGYDYRGGCTACGAPKKFDQRSLIQGMNIRSHFPDHEGWTVVTVRIGKEQVAVGVSGDLVRVRSVGYLPFQMEIAPDENQNRYITAEMRKDEYYD